MSDDFLQSLGVLALGTRLKRAGGQIQAATQAWLDARGFPVAATHMPVLAALDRYEALPVGTLAAMLGQAQPGVTRMTAQLETDGWLASRAHEGDGRVRVVMLTHSGRELVREAGETLWPHIARAVSGLCRGLEEELGEGAPDGFAGQLGALEDRLAAGRFAALLNGEDAV